MLKRCPEAKILGFKTASQWQENTSLEIDGQELLVAQCDSQLAIREFILKANERNLKLAFITKLEDLDLGNDIRALLAKRRLIPIKPWESVKELFQAKAIDVTVLKKQWLADVLLNMAPAEGYPVVADGFLTAEKIWEEVLFLLLGFKTPRPVATDILEWALDAKRILLLNKLAEMQFQDICGWIQYNPDALEVFLLNLLKSSPCFNLLTLGLALEVTSSDMVCSDVQLRDASVRLEKYTNNRPVSPQMAQRWKNASCQVFKKLVDTNVKGMITEIQTKLDYLLQEIGAKEYAWLSSVSLLGFEQRLSRFAKSLGKMRGQTKIADFKKLEDLLTNAGKHIAALKSSKRLERMRMALRLCHWLAHNKDHSILAKNFVEASTAYAKDGAFVDRARIALQIGDECRDLSTAYNRVMKQVEKSREIQNKHFAELLQKWTEAGSKGQGLIRVEDFLEKIVAPIAKKHPLLVIVMDGMSHAVFSELKEDLILNNAWVELTHKDWAPQKPMIAALPTITEVSRRSLLCGKLTADPKDDECKGFTQYDHLRASSGSMPPKLFHKADLCRIDGTDLAESVRNEILTPRRRVIGVVVNAVDDSLYRSDQISNPWRIENIPILSQLLHVAREGERTVIITSDHGHVLEYHSVLYNHETGERWRPDDENLHDGEITIKGTRVLKPKEGKAIFPFSEHIRYGKKKNGYHGGVTPQEVVVPLTVIKWQQIPKGWEAIPFYQPLWWNISFTESTLPDDVPTPLKAEPKIALKNQMRLFPPKGKKDEVEWITGILKSPVLVNQTKLCGRAVLSDTMIREFLRTIESHGGTVLQTALAQSLGQPLLRIRGIISIMQRILNVDGYSVLSFDSGAYTVNINLKLLRTQFKV